MTSDRAARRSAGPSLRRRALPASALTGLFLLALGALLASPAGASGQDPVADRDAVDSAAEEPRGPRTSTLTGRVFFPASGEPVRDAEVLLLEQKRRTFTDAAGRFEISGLRPGHDLLQVRLAGERKPPEPVIVPAGYRLTIELTAQPTGARTMEELVVQVERERSRWKRRLERFERQARSLGKRYVDRELIRELDPTDLSQIFTYLSPAFAPPFRFTFDGVFRLRMRRNFTIGRGSAGINGGPQTIFGRSAPSRGVFGPQSGVGFCVPTVFVNGSLWTAPLGDLPPDDVIGITLYESPFVPGEYRLHAEGCGVVVAWTDWGEPGLGPEDAETD